MTGRRIQSLGLGAFLLIVGMLPFLLIPTHSMKDKSFDLESGIPKTFDGWKIDPDMIPVKPTPDVQQQLDRTYDQWIARTYVNAAGERIMLTMAYGGDQSDSLKAHRQEYCYAAQGFAISDLHHASLAVGRISIPVVQLVATARDRVEPVSYWFTMGGVPVVSRLERTWAQIRFGLKGRIPDGMLIRISSISTQSDQAFASHAAFANALKKAIASPTVRQIAGFAEL